MSVDKATAFQEILAQNPDDAFARYGLAMEYRQRGEAILALEQFDELQKRHPDYTAGYQMAAQALMADGKTLEAEQRLHTGIASARRTRNQHALAEMEGMLDELKEQDR
jgi:predicted Zn-dependent protease